MGYDADSLDPDNLCVLNDICIFDTVSRRWCTPSQPATQATAPRPRYAHLSSVSGDKLFIIGGLDLHNAGLTDVCVYDFLANTWSENRDYPRHCSFHGSVAVASNQRVCFPQDDGRLSPIPTPRDRDGAAAPFRKSDAILEDLEPTASFTNLPYSSAADAENPSYIYLYSNSKVPEILLIIHYVIYA